MDYSMGDAGGFGDEDTHNSQKGKGNSYKRLSNAQTAALEKFIKECPHPDETQRRQLAGELKLEPRQIKFWFQNKRTQLKNLHDRADNNALRVENDRIYNENLQIREAMKKTLCATCGGPPFPKEEHEEFMKKMKLENAQLKEEHEKLSNLLARFLEKQMSPPELQQAITEIAGTSSDAGLGLLLNQAVDDGSSTHHHHDHDDHDHHQCHGTPINIGDGVLVHNPMDALENEKALVTEMATIAMEELVRLVRLNDPLWVNSSTHQDGQLTLDLESYERVFPKRNRFKGTHVCVESSKYTGIVNITGMQLVDMFLDSVKWGNLFPTIVTKSETIKVIESGLLANRSGALQLMYEEMHILSPLVRPREFHFLRYCQQIDVGVWVITDVSFDHSPAGQNSTLVSRSWKHPSGCMIRELPNGSCVVTWVEHVEVDDKIHTHRLFRYLIGNVNYGYGAEAWVAELQRMGERSASFYVEKIPDHDSGGVITSLEGRKSVMKLAHRMVKMFCESLTMPGQVDFPELTSDLNNGGVRVAVHRSSGIGQPDGMVVTAATSLWIPLPYQKVFAFLTDHKKRSQWDVLSSGSTVHEIAHISNGIHPGNFITIVQPFSPCENNALVLQESFTSPAGSYVIYAPVDIAAVHVAIRGGDSSVLQILPSGFVVSGDGQLPNADGSGGGGSLLTVAFQILACSTDGIMLLNMESVAAVNTLLTSTVQKLKDALNSKNLE